MKTANFIVLEGLDGTGKTTQLQLLAEALGRRGRTVFTDAEPTAAPTGRFLRRMLAGELPANEWANAALFFADRVHHNAGPDGLISRLARGETVLLDRYFYSTLAYQGVNTDPEWVMDMHYGCPGIAIPQLVLFLTLSPEESLRRIAATRAGRPLEIYETEERLRDIARRFELVFPRLRGGETVVRVDASGTKEEVTARLLAAVDAYEEGSE